MDKNNINLNNIIEDTKLDSLISDIESYMREVGYNYEYVNGFQEGIAFVLNKNIIELLEEYKNNKNKIDFNLFI